jgi:flagellar P-ring protein precursor FlgI
MALLAATSPRSIGATIQELVRLEGQGESVLQGFGLVTGLPGTGDSGEQLLVARPMAKMLEQMGAPVDSFEDLSESRSVAVVIVQCRIPETGAKKDDAFDVTVTAIHNPESLRGGQLFLAPLRGPYPGHPVFAVAEGALVVDADNPARAVVRGGARMIRDIDMTTIAPDGSVTLVIDPAFAGWSTAQLIANTINDHRLGLNASADRIARARDERTVHVRIPRTEIGDPANFLSDILSIRFDPSLLALPAMVRINERDGVIVVTGDVEISPVLITHEDLVITTVTPPQEGAPATPIVEQNRWSPLTTSEQAGDTARLEDLLRAFKQLNVPIDDQIAILAQLKRTGRLHAELIFD